LLQLFGEDRIVACEHVLNLKFVLRAADVRARFASC